VREVLLVTSPTTVLGVADVAVVALVSRLLMTVGDLFASGIAVLVCRPGRNVDTTTDVLLAHKKLRSGCGSRRPSLDMATSGESQSPP
jgi:hypothetical protein